MLTFIKKTLISACKMKQIEAICFFEVNTKYISSNVFKVSEFSGVRNTSENFMFSTHEMKYVWYSSKKKQIFFFISYNTRAFSNSQGRR